MLLMTCQQQVLPSYTSLSILTASLLNTFTRIDRPFRDRIVHLMQTHPVTAQLEEALQALITNSWSAQLPATGDAVLPIKRAPESAGTLM